MTGQTPGSVPFKYKGADYVLLLDFNALCDLEEEIPDIMEGGADVRKPSMVRTLFHAGLQRHHAGTSKTEAGEMIQELGIGEARVMLDRSLREGFARGEDGEEPDEPAENPPNTTAERPLPRRRSPGPGTAT